MVDWYVDAEFVGALTRDQMESASAGAFLAHYNEKSQVLRLRQRLDVDTYQGALDAAAAWVAGLPANTALVADGVLDGPIRLCVESDVARAYQWDLLGTAEIAARLGVSTARVRQLADTDGFPPPVTELAGGKVYRAVDVEAWMSTWPRARTGRPRKRAGGA